MCPKVAVVYNEPVSSRYSLAGEEKAVTGVLDAVNAVHQALIELGYEVVRAPLLPPVEQARKLLRELKIDLIFNLFEGFCGYPETEALMPEVAAELGVSCTGCPAGALTLALDKARVKDLLNDAGIATPGYQLLKPDTLSLFKLAYPCIVKPRSEDASHGLTEASVVYDFDSLEKQVKAISGAYGGEALVEEYIEGREFNVTVLGNAEYRALPPSEIAYNLPAGKPRILTFASKWEPDNIYFKETRAVCPAPVSAQEAEQITGVARKVYRMIGCRGYARVDMRADSRGKLWAIEVNPNPDISPGSGAARQAAAAGMDYTRFIEKLARLALENQEHISIRIMTREDKDQVMRMLYAIPEFQPAEVAVAEEVIDSYLHNPDSGYCIIVAEAGSSVVGYICYGPTPLTEGTWDIYWMSTQPKRQGQGIGKALLQFAEDKIREAHGRLAFIETSSKPEYEKTRLFHSHRGYKLVAQINDFYAPGDHKLILQKRFS